MNNPILSYKNKSFYMKVLDDDKIVSLYNENVGVYNIAKQS